VKRGEVLPASNRQVLHPFGPRMSRAPGGARDGTDHGQTDSLSQIRPTLETGSRTTAGRAPPTSTRRPTWRQNVRSSPHTTPTTRTYSAMIGESSDRRTLRRCPRRHASSRSASCSTRGFCRDCKPVRGATKRSCSSASEGAQCGRTRSLTTGHRYGRRSSTHALTITGWSNGRVRTRTVAPSTFMSSGTGRRPGCSRSRRAGSVSTRPRSFRARWCKKILTGTG
jgi:hypothetical protein